MRAHECFHCKQWIPEGVEHDCWTTTEQALTKGLPEELRDAWERLRETAVEFGDQRIYASHHSIMFSRKTCYFFVRPQRNRLELVFFLSRPIASTQFKKTGAASKTKFWHMLHVIHRDQVEKPLTDWLREAYGREDQLPQVRQVPRAPQVRKKARAPQVQRKKATAPKRARAKPKRRK